MEKLSAAIQSTEGISPRETTSTDNISNAYSPPPKRTTFSIDSILSQKLTSDTNQHQNSKEMKTKYSMSYKYEDLHEYNDEKYSALHQGHISPCSFVDECTKNGYRSSIDELLGLKYSRTTNCYEPCISADIRSSLALYKYDTSDEENDKLINKRRRTIFTTSQLERLEYEFQYQQYIVGQERRYLAKQLGLNEIQVKVWFQNRRIKWRKFTHGNAAMPDLSM